ncbi:MAG: YabP/YqfC family sporulation protein [Ruminococcus sp.]|uniref:YabP/YqfC family sporulation protein n=1 Tax=Ruminococcus sp. TaxID=41978 RepID=UPI002872D132|nr:YabP/YqfC family sporulation protein [Ruminococcus sp.]MBQ3284508.1 YabP/YqfC family sporulation protein [Ruminococcus sp.]
MKDKQKEKRRASALPVLNEPCIELSGNREILIEGGRGVLEYTDEAVRVNTDSMILTVAGRGLNLKCISDSALIISGFITSLRFEA